VAAAPTAQARPEARPSNGGTAPVESENRPDEGGTAALGETAPVGTAPPGDTAGGWGRLQFDLDCSREDHARYYSWQGLGGLALGLALAAPLANTPADRSVRRWYADKVHSDSLDALATAWGAGGQLWVLAPIGVEAAALCGKDWGADGAGGLGEWGHRSLRALAVGFPPVLVLFGALGSGRPDRGDSHWHPFRDVHGVSGHTFVGAVPFLTAAAMTDDPWWQSGLLAASFVSGWTRLHDDRHYVSQIALGWWLAYLAVRSVDEAQDARRRFRVAPAFWEGGGGIELGVSY